MRNLIGILCIGYLGITKQTHLYTDGVQVILFASAHFGRAWWLVYGILGSLMCLLVDWGRTLSWAYLLKLH